MSGISEIRDTVRGLSALERKDLVVETARTLNEDDRKALALALGAPTQSVTNEIWLRVVTAFVVVLVGAFAAMAAYIYLGKGVETMLTVFTTVAAFLGGLLAPSPLGGRTQ